MQMLAQTSNPAPARVAAAAADCVLLVQCELPLPWLTYHNYQACSCSTHCRQLLGKRVFQNLCVPYLLLLL
jgi:hypothetical protein